MINIEKAKIVARLSGTLYVAIFFCKPTKRYATMMLMINGVKTPINKLKIINVSNMIRENTIVSSLLKMRLNIFDKCLIKNSNNHYI